MLTQTIPVHYYQFDGVHPNPFQTRDEEDPAHIQELADSIKERGMLQLPLARPKPGTLILDGVPTEIELAFGHSRFAAWKIVRPHDSFPVQIRDLTDQQMAEHAITENAKRKDLSAVEKAKAARRYMDTFRVSQKEAAQLFGYKDAASLSNLLAILHLPAASQTLVQQGALPEQYARRFARLAKSFPNDVDKAAKKVADAKEEEREHTFTNALDDVLRTRAKSLDHWDVPFPLDFPAKPIKLADANSVKGEPSEIPACNGCPFNFKQRGSQYCLRAACYDRKAIEYAKHEAAAAAKKTGIPLAAADEKAEIVWKGNWNGRDIAEKAVKKKGKHLRLVPVADVEHGGHYVENLLGSKHVVLATTDTKQYAKDAKIEMPAAIQKGDSTASALEKQRAAQEKAKAQYRAREREFYQQQGLVVMQTIARAAAPILPANLRLLKLMAEAIDVYDITDSWDDSMGRLREGKIKNVPEAQGILAVALIGTELNGCLPPTFRDDVKRLQKELPALAKELKFKLPKNWDAPLLEPLDKVNLDDHVNREIVSWLKTTPPNDVNFKSNLKDANAETLRAALKAGIATKTARQAVEARLRVLENAGKKK